MPSLRDLDPRQSWPGLLLAAGGGLTLLFTLLRPDASDGLSAPARLIFWAAHVFLLLALLQGAQLLCLRWPPLARLNPWVQTALSGLLGAAVFTPLALVLDAAFGFADGAESALLSALAEEFLVLAPVVLLVWLGLNATRLIRLTPARRTEENPPPGMPEFWDRVPRKLGRDLVALSAELHYLRVRTTLGEALILYPFGRAIDSLRAGGSGLRIHRSHWVAAAHVRAVDRRGQGGLCTLSTGLVLPVSRPARAAAEALVDERG
jgi:hypothetical protein